SPAYAATARLRHTCRHRRCRTPALEEILMPFTYSRTFRVRYYECDAYGHLNNANYLRYMQETAFDASAAAGYGLQAYEALGHFWLIRETDIEYRRPLRYDDTVTVTTWVANFRRARSQRVY